jgi:hypothetical protein
VSGLLNHPERVCRAVLTWLGRGIFVAGLAAIVFVAAGSFRPAPGLSGTPGQLTAPAAEPVPPPRVVGIAGCASAACHGGPASVSLTRPSDPRRWACSATVWLTGDPHAKAYAALESELAGRIMSRLHWPGKATEEARCLACHTNPALAAELKDQQLVALRREGVSCEGCHGSAGGWLHEHTTWTPATRTAGYDRTGMAKLYDLGERSIACAGCHVGAPADPARGYPVRDMNHDMVAAGHPRLNFDFADYQRSLPPHWSERDRATGTPAGPEFEVRAWLVGRVAHAEAACRLLEDRAKRAERNEAPWPEFAEWNCVSCHHRIDGTFPRKTGTPTWQTVWPVTDPDGFAAAGRFGPVPDIRGLFRVMEKLHPAIPATAARARSAADGLAGLRAALTAAPGPEVREAAGSMPKSAGKQLRSLDRDTAGQLFHALAALERTRLREMNETEPPPAFADLRRELMLSRGTLRFDVPPGARADLEVLLKRVK